MRPGAQHQYDQQHRNRAVWCAADLPNIEHPNHRPAVLWVPLVVAWHGVYGEYQWLMVEGAWVLAELDTV